MSGGAQPGTSVVVDDVEVDVVVLEAVVVGTGDVLEELLDVLVVELLVDVVVGRGGQATGAGAFFASNFPGSSRVTVPPSVAQ
jgi:hypothetical protein